jgi:23S rRNA (uridine2552-2'-O)-methyltransferase
LQENCEDLGAAPGGWSQVVAERFGLLDGPEDSATANTKEETDIWALPATPFDENAGKKTRSRKERLQERDAKRAEQRADDGDMLDPPPRHPGRGRGRRGPPVAEEEIEEEETKTSPIPSVPQPDTPRTIVALDLLRMEPIHGVHALQTNFLTPDASFALRNLLRTPENPSGRADVILSDMAANVTGHRDTDVQSSLDIASAVWDFARVHLRTAEEVGRPNAGVLL